MTKHIGWWIIGLICFAAMDLAAAPYDITGKTYLFDAVTSSSPNSTIAPSFETKAPTSNTDAATNSNLINQTDGGAVQIKTKTPTGTVVPGAITIESGAGGASPGTSGSSVTIRARGSTHPIGVNGKILLETLTGGTDGGDVEIRMAPLDANFGIGNGTQMSSITPRGYGIWQQFRLVIDSYTVANVPVPPGAPGTFTLDTSSSAVNIACNDTDGCTITMGETNASNGQVMFILNAQSNVSTITDTSGVAELSGNAVLGQWDSIILMYSNDRWVQYAPESDN